MNESLEKEPAWAAILSDLEDWFGNALAVAAELMSMTETVSAARQRCRAGKRVPRDKISYDTMKEAKRYKATGTRQGLSALGSRMVHLFENPDHEHSKSIVLVPGAEGVRVDMNWNETILFVDPSPLSEMKEILQEGFTVKRNELSNWFALPANKGARGSMGRAGKPADWKKLSKWVQEHDIFGVIPDSVENFPPFVVMLKQDHVRWGHSSLAFWGFGCFVDPVVVTTISMESLVDLGQMSTLDDFPVAIERRRFVLKRDSLPVTTLKAGSYLWVPYGHLPIMISMIPLSSVMVIPWLSSRVPKDHTPQVNEMLWTGMMRYLRDNTQRPWDAIAEHFSKFKQAAEMMKADDKAASQE